MKKILFTLCLISMLTALSAQPTVKSTNSISIYPTSVTMDANSELRFTVIAKTHRGTHYTPNGIQWYATGGTINQRGKLTTGNQGGFFTVTATLGSLRATASVNVKQQYNHNKISRIELNPTNATVRVGRTYRFSATGYNRRGNVVSFQPNWSVTGGGYISSNGTFTAQYPGQYSVIAKDPRSNVSQSAVVNVTQQHQGGQIHRIAINPFNVTVAPNNSYQFQATAYDRYNRVVHFNPTWSSSVGRISSNGLFQAPGYQTTATIYARCSRSGAQATASVTIRGNYNPYPIPTPHPPHSNARIVVSKWDVGGGNFLRPDAKIRLKVHGKRVQTVKLMSVSNNGNVRELQAYSVSNGKEVYFKTKYDRFAVKYLEIRVYDRQGNVIARDKRSV